MEEHIDEEKWWQKNALLPFHSSTTILVSGSTMTGKSELIRKMLKKSSGMFEVSPKRIIYAFCEYQNSFSDMEQDIPGIIMHQGLPSKDQITQWTDPSQHTVLVLDDLMNEVTKNEDSVSLFCITAHHRFCTVIFVTQNLYMPNRYSRTISLNCHYVILFKNFRDSRSIITFGSQLLPGKVNFFRDAYEKATAEPFSYLLCDLSPKTSQDMRFRSKILPNEDTVIFLPK